MARQVSSADLPIAPPLGWRVWSGWLARARATLLAERLLLGLIGCYVALGLAASLLMPPWQAPDEPAHFEHARQVLLGTTSELPEVQRPIIATFYDYRFWEYRGVATPTNPPAAFSQMPGLLIRQVTKTPLYYWLAAVVSSWTDDTILQLYSMRWLSVLLSACTIPLVFLAAREVLPASRAGLALVAGALVAFLPMYGYIGASVNPDAIGAPLSAGMIWLAIRALRGKQTAAALAGVIALAVLAYWARRSAIAGLPWAALLAGPYLLAWASQRMARPLVAFLVLLVLGGSLAVVLWPSTTSAAAWFPTDARWGQTRSDRFAYAGTHSLYIRRTDQQAPIETLAQTLDQPVVADLAGRTVVLDTMVHSGATRTSGRLVIMTTSGRAAVQRLVATERWTHARLTYIVPTDTLKLHIFLAVDRPGEIFFDQVQLLDAQSGQPVAQMSNTGGEEALFWWQARFADNQVVQYLTRIIQAGRDGLYHSPKALALYPGFFAEMLTSLVGRFGWMTFGLSDPLYLLIGLIAAGMLLGLVRLRRTSTPVPGLGRVLAWLALLVLMTIMTIMLDYTTYLNPRAYPQGRYLFPVLAALATFLVIGLAQWLPERYDRRGAMVCIALLIALDLWSWAVVIVPHFYG